MLSQVEDILKNDTFGAGPNGKTLIRDPQQYCARIDGLFKFLKKDEYPRHQFQFGGR